MLTPSQLPQIPVFLFSLLQSYHKNVYIFLTPTDRNYSVSHYERTIALANELSGRRSVFLSNINPVEALLPWKVPLSLPDANEFGYVVTDLMLDLLVNATARQLRDGALSLPVEGDNLALPHALDNDPHAPEDYLCKYFLVTNADNMYNGALFKLTSPHMHAGVDLVGFDFTNRYDDWVLKRAKLQWTDLDLGSALISTAYLRQTRLRFLLDDLHTANVTELAALPKAVRYRYFSDRDGWLWSRMRNLKVAGRCEFVALS
jgi:hypothetical protein